MSSDNVQRAPTQAPERSLGELLGDLTDQTRTLVQQEMALAKAEIRQELKAAGKAGGKLAAAGVVAHMGWLMVSLAIAWGIAAFLPIWVGFAIVGVLYLAVGAVLGKSGQEQLQKVEPTPDRAIEEAKRTKQMTQEHT